MRARRRRRQADELAAVLAWLRDLADSMAEARDALGRTPRLAPDAEVYGHRAAALRDAAARLERGEHRAP